MSSTIPPSHNERVAPPRLTIQRPDGGEFFCEIDAGNGIIVGADSTCGLQLEGAGVAALHCMIRHENGRPIVKDWYTVNGTFINETKIEAEMVLPEGGVIRVGQFKITADVAAATDTETVEQTATEPPLETPAPSPVDNVPASEILDGPKWLNGEDAGGDPFSTQDAFDANSDFGYSDDYSQGEVDSETFALLKSKVEHLQNEVAERDARLAELAANDNDEQPTGDNAANVEPSETAALVDRLEQLLDELNQTDARMSTMEKLLLLAEEANVAEQEERRQLEAWVGEIETRVGEREAEWTAELEVSKQRIEDISTERDRAETRLGKAGSSPDAQEEFQRTLAQVRHQAEVLRDALEESRQENSALESRLENASGDQAEETIRQRIDEALRAERLHSVQEQATLARERAEISRMKMEMERAQPPQATPAGPSNATPDVDGKFRAFREHLKELQEKEAQERKEHGLSARLSSLWKRLEGR